MTRRVLIGIWLLLTVLEVGSSILAYWTLGWTDSFLFLFGTGFLNVCPLAICQIRAWPGPILAVCCGLPLICYQAMLGLKWVLVSSEARGAVEWVNSEEGRTGGLPDDLSGYVFRHPEYTDVVTYHKWVESNQAKWEVVYTVGSKSSYYSYTPEFGWFYHDD